MNEKMKQEIVNILNEKIPQKYYQVWSHLYSNIFNTPNEIFEIFDLYSRELGLGVDDNTIHQRISMEEDNIEFKGYVELFGTREELKIPAVSFYLILYDLCFEIDKVVKIRNKEIYLNRFKILIKKYQKEFPLVIELKQN